MLDRVKTKEKSKVQWILPVEVIEKIRVESARAGKTQSKYIYDILEAAWEEKSANDA